MSKKVPNVGYWHQWMDRASVLLATFSEHVLDELEEYEDAGTEFQSAEKAHKALFDCYTELGKRFHEEGG